MTTSGGAKSIEVVSFHASRPQADGGAHPNANLAVDEYMRMLDLLFRSARLFHPGADCTLLTNGATRMQGIRGKVRRVDAAVDHDALMFSRSLAQLAYVEESDFARPMLLIDSDILLRRSLRRVFERDFDVALTWRASASMPINGGLILLNNRRPERVRAYFRRFVDIYKAHYSGDGQSAWYGDQLALRDSVGVGHREMARTPEIEVDGCRILFLPCDTYNFSPDNSYAAIASGLADKSVLHFKGQRKRLMLPFWRTFLQPQETGGMLGGLQRRLAQWRFDRESRNDGTPPTAASDEDDE